MLVWEDRAYGLIAWKQESEFGRHTDLSFGNPDWMKLADAFGWHGHHVENSADLAATLAQALDEPGPSLVVVPIDYRENMLLTESSVSAWRGLPSSFLPVVPPSRSPLWLWVTPAASRSARSP